MISSVWYLFYNGSLWTHYGNFSSIAGKLYNESVDKLGSKTRICILIQLSKSFIQIKAGQDTLQILLVFGYIIGCAMNGFRHLTQCPFPIS